MTKDYELELQRIQEIALDHAIEEMDAADERGVKTSGERGDRGFLTGMASKSIGVAVKIEQFLALRRGGHTGGDDDKEEEKAKASLIKNARGEVAAIMERVSVGSKRRGQ